MCGPTSELVENVQPWNRRFGRSVLQHVVIIKPKCVQLNPEAIANELKLIASLEKELLPYISRLKQLEGRVRLLEIRIFELERKKQSRLSVDIQDILPNRESNAEHRQEMI